jgi:signal transduction histidine kinase
VRKIRRALEATGGVDDEIEAELSKIHTSVSLVLSVGKKLAHELSGDRYGEPKDRRGNPRVYPVRALLQHGIDILALDEDMQQKIRIKLAVPQDSLAVKVDYGQFADALLNLLMNAVHAMMPDGGSLMVGAQRRADEVEIWVQDTGHGISPRHLAISSTSALPRKREAPASVSGASRRRSSTAAG